MSLEAMTITTVITAVTGATLIFGAYGIARLWPSTSSRLTVLGLASFSILVAACHLLGTLAAAQRKSVLGPTTLLVTVLCFAVLIWSICRRRMPRRLEPESTVPSDYDRSDGGGPGPDRTSRRHAIALVTVACALVLPHAIILAVSAPPRGWDVLAYHLPRAIAWLQHGNLGHYGSLPALYPGNGELLALFSIFSGTDRLAPLIQLPFALLGCVAVYGTARELGARARHAAIASVVFLATPMVIFQSALAKNDLIVTALLLSAVFLFCRSLRPPNGHGMWGLDLFFSGLALGLAFGTKYSAFPFALSAVLIMIAVQVWHRRSRGHPTGTALLRFAARTSGTLIAAVAIPSAFWLIQNWIVTGNPVAPLTVSIGEWTVFPGVEVMATYAREQLKYVPRASAWWYYPWIDRHVGASYSGSAGFGAGVAVAAIPGLLFLAWRGLSRGLNTTLRTVRATVLALVVTGAVTWWFGGHGLPRFLLPTVGLACAPIGLMFQCVRRCVRRALLAIVLVSLALSFGETLRIVYGARDLISSRMPWMTRAEYYHMPDLIYRLPPLTRILLLSVEDWDYHRTFRYPLAGDLPGNDVVMADDGGVRIRVTGAGAGAFHRDLMSSGVEYVFIRTLASPLSGTWLDKHPDLFDLVVDTVEEPYVWHREFYIRVEGEDTERRAQTVTKIYRVLGTRS